MSKNIKVYNKKIAKLPKNSNTSELLERIKVKSSLWYVIVEQQKNDSDELHLIKCSDKGENLNIFVAQLKEQYIKNISNPELKKIISNIQVIGNGGFSVIKNIPDVNISLTKEGKSYDKKILQMIMDDLISLLAKK